MDFVKNIWRGQKRAEAGFCAKANRFSSVWSGWKILHVSILKDSAA
jgi:hypothetical protein